MALLNRFSRLNDRGETGIFTFIVTKSVTRDFHRDATTKDFCFGYHRWAISFQRPSEKVLGVHLLLRNPSPNTACVVDFSLTLVNRQHFSQNESYTKKQAKFTITNPMQGVARWIQMSELTERNFSTESGEFLFELTLSNMSTIFECDIQLNAAILNQYKSMLKDGTGATSGANRGTPEVASGNKHQTSGNHGQSSGASSGASAAKTKPGSRNNSSELINLETNYFTFGSFDWSLTIVPLVMAQATGPTPNQRASARGLGVASSNLPPTPAKVHLEPVCRVYLNRLTGFESLCRVKYRVILGHHQPAAVQTQQQPPQHHEHADSRLLDQISDSSGRIRGYQFRNTNILKLISLRCSLSQPTPTSTAIQGQQQPHYSSSTPSNSASSSGGGSALDLRVHIEMFCANTVSEARVPLHRKSNELQVNNCQDRNKQAWSVEADIESSDSVRLKLFFLDLQSVPRNHIRYISWIAYIVRRQANGSARDSIVVRNAPHSNYYLQDGIDMGTIMDTDLAVKELQEASANYLEDDQLTVHIEWVDSLLLFSHLYNNYDSLATVQRHQIRRELNALQQEFAHLESKYVKAKRSLKEMTGCGSADPSKACSRSQARTLAGDDNQAELDFSSAANSSDSLAVESASLQETEPLPVAGVTANNLSSTRPASSDKVEIPLRCRQLVVPSGVGERSSSPAADHHNHQPTAAAAPTSGGPVSKFTAHSNGRLLDTWTAAGAGCDSLRASSTRRRLPQQPVGAGNGGRQLLQQQHDQRLLYGRLSQVSLGAASAAGYLAASRASLDLDSAECRSISPSVLLRRSSQLPHPAIHDDTEPELQLRPDEAPLYEDSEADPSDPYQRYAAYSAPQHHRPHHLQQHLAVEPLEVAELAYGQRELADPELEALYQLALVDREPIEPGQLAQQHPHLRRHHHPDQPHLAPSISGSVSPSIRRPVASSQLEQFMILEQFGSL